MSGEGLVALAQWAGQTVVAAAITDGWESIRGRFARLLGRGDARKTRVTEQWLAQTHELLADAADGELEPVRVAQAQRWAGRFADLLDEDPGVEAEFRALLSPEHPDTIDTRSSLAHWTGEVTARATGEAVPSARRPPGARRQADR